MSDDLRTSATTISKAPRSVIFELVSTANLWPVWSPFKSVVLDQPGEDGKDGVGAIKKITFMGTTSREKILSVDPDRGLTYTYISGALRPFLTDYVGAVQLEDVEGGTSILWRCSFRHKFPGSGYGPYLMLKSMLPRMTSSLSKYAEKTGGTKPNQ